MGDDESYGTNVRVVLRGRPTLRVASAEGERLFRRFPAQ